MKKIGIKILLVEDNKIVQKAHMIILEEITDVIDIACTGEEALKLLKENYYDVVLMDIGLPDMNGIEVIKNFHQFSIENHVNQGIKIIVITAQEMSDIEDSCLKIGCDIVLSKPTTLKVLKAHFLALGLL